MDIEIISNLSKKWKICYRNLFKLTKFILIVDLNEILIEDGYYKECLKRGSKIKEKRNTKLIDLKQ